MCFSCELWSLLLSEWDESWREEREGREGKGRRGEEREKATLMLLRWDCQTGAPRVASWGEGEHGARQGICALLEGSGQRVGGWMGGE